MPTKMLAVYGNIALEREYCQECHRFSIVIDGLLQCCDSKSTSTPSKIKRISEPEQVKRKPGKLKQEQILNSQNNKCYYCGAAFNSFTRINGEEKLIKVHFDHKVPFRFSQNNDLGNFVAACQFCNAVKSDHVFDSEEQMQLTILTRLAENGFSHAKKALGILSEEL